MNDNDQFDAMDEMSDWAVANARLLADMDRLAQMRKHLDARDLQPLNKETDNLYGTDSRPLDP